MAYIKKIWKDYPDTTTPILASDMNNIENGIENIENGIENIETGISNGWVSAGETWEYASVDDPTGVIYATGDVTQKYSVGMRIKFTNNSNTVYGIITALSSYDSGNDRTSVTFLHEINPSNSQALYLMQNSAITDNYYSLMKTPYGFPLNPDKWSVTKTITSDITGTTTSNWQNVGSLYIDVPIGLFNIETGIFFEVTGTGTPSGRLCISTSATAGNISNARLKYQGTTSISGVIKITHNLTSKTRYYGNIEFAYSGSNGGITLRGANSNYDLQPYIKATSTYL